MAAEQRDFVNVDTYEGELRQDGYYFPIIRYADKAGHVRVWKSVCRLVKKENNLDKIKLGINWNIMQFTPVVHVPELLNAGAKLGDDVFCQYWYEAGREDGKISRYAPTIPKKMNIGKANERNVFHQGLIELRSKWLEKRKTHGEVEEDEKCADNSLWWPTLAHSYKKFFNKIAFPAYCQPKLDGARTIAFYNRVSDEVVLYTRNGQMVPGMEQLRVCLKPLLLALYDQSSGVSCYFDGELYGHSEHLKDISGWVRNEKKNNTDLENTPIRYNIFDLFYPEPSRFVKLNVEQRHATLTQLIDAFKFSVVVEEVKESSYQTRAYQDLARYCDESGNVIYGDDKLKDSEPFKTFAEWVDCLKSILAMEKTFDITFHEYEWVRIVGFTKVTSKAELMAYYYELLEQKYEGLIVRNNVPYVTNCKNKSTTRSYDMQKLKPKFDGEFKIVGYKKGKGGNEGLLIWKLETLHQDPSQRKTFWCSPKNITNDERETYYTKFRDVPAVFNSYFKDTLIKVEYEDLSPDGVPQRAKALTDKPDPRYF